MSVTPTPSPPLKIQQPLVTLTLTSLVTFSGICTNKKQKDQNPIINNDKRFTSGCRQDKFQRERKSEREGERD